MGSYFVIETSLKDRLKVEDWVEKARHSEMSHFMYPYNGRPLNPRALLYSIWIEFTYSSIQFHHTSDSKCYANAIGIAAELAKRITVYGWGWEDDILSPEECARTPFPRPYGIDLMSLERNFLSKAFGFLSGERRRLYTDMVLMERACADLVQRTWDVTQQR